MGTDLFAFTNSRLAVSHELLGGLQNQSKCRGCVDIRLLFRISALVTVLMNSGKSVYSSCLDAGMVAFLSKVVCVKKVTSSARSLV